MTSMEQNKYLFMMFKMEVFPVIFLNNTSWSLEKKNH